MRFIATIIAIAISNDDRFIVSGGTDCSIKVFDLETNQEAMHFEAVHKGTSSFLSKHNFNAFRLGLDHSYI